MESMFDTINYDYRDDFWKLIEKYKVYDKISVDIFGNIVLNKYFILKDVRYRKNKKAFAWTCERNSHIWVNVKEDPECRDFWRNTYPSVDNRK